MVCVLRLSTEKEGVGAQRTWISLEEVEAKEEEDKKKEQTLVQKLMGRLKVGHQLLHPLHWKNLSSVLANCCEMPSSSSISCCSDQQSVITFLCSFRVMMGAAGDGVSFDFHDTMVVR
ncbi:hypothetical protein Taro_038569 [Colocasia esculenta]|uniref:Uncharacterized protein n=1 Tax=Colocasia esculenta TaxID=4460 RepID=A0A843WG87_COLES|nr:hypothetical protein [Colocasia esculenta]